MYIKKQVSLKPLCILKQKPDLDNFRVESKTKKHDLLIVFILPQKGLAFIFQRRV